MQAFPTTLSTHKRNASYIPRAKAQGFTARFDKSVGGSFLRKRADLSPIYQNLRSRNGSSAPLVKDELLEQNPCAL